MDVSIIITTKNEEANIFNCLNSIKKQDYPQEKIEIIVVDNNSSDRTKQIALEFTQKVYNYGPERSTQRNFGVRKAIGKYILYLDADMVLSKDLISQCINKCESERLLALYIPEEIIGKGYWIKVRDFERSFYNATCIDAVRFIRRDKFLKIDGFDETLTGPEDWDFDRRINFSEKDLISSPIYHNEGNFSLKRYLQKKCYYSFSFNTYLKKWGKQDREVKKQFSFLYRYFGVFLEKGKWQKILLHPLLAIGVFYLRFLVGVNYILIKYGYKKPKI